METITIAKLHGLDHKERASICGVIKVLKLLETRTGDRMAVATVEDSTGVADVVVFADSFMPNEELLTTCDKPIYFAGDVNEGDETSPRLIVSESTEGFCKRQFEEVR